VICICYYGGYQHQQAAASLSPFNCLQMGPALNDFETELELLAPLQDEWKEPEEEALAFRNSAIAENNCTAAWFQSI